MARRESIAVGGFFPTPDPVVESVLSMFRPPEAGGNPYQQWNRPILRLLDPCAGEGVAIKAAAERLGGEMYAVEMEATRYAALSHPKRHDNRCLHGDFFKLDTGNAWVTFCWLNPPYDTDRETKRLEERFLRRATPLMAPDGYLVFVVPGYALAASAITLATHYADLQCWRFPGDLYEQFKQVVLVARKKASAYLDPAAETLVRAWAADPATIRDLPSEAPVQITAPVTTNVPGRFTLLGIDLTAIRQDFAPWVSDKGPVMGIEPATDLAAEYNRSFPVASTPRATHLAAALAAGVFNGARVTPDDPDSGLPPLLVKGVFDKEFRTVETRENSAGEKIAEVQVQHPSLQVTVLDLEAGQFHTILPSAEMPLVTGIEGMTLANLLDSYGLSLMDAMRRACPVLHDPSRGDPEVEPRLAQPLFPAQRSAMNTILRLRSEWDAAGGIVLGEIGSGKTRVALAVSAEMEAKHTIVMCPPHLLTTWHNETRAVLPDTRVVTLDTIYDVEAFFADPGPVVGVLSRERAKLGHAWGSVEGRCPSCGGRLPDRDFSTRRECCPNVRLEARNEAAEWLVRNAFTLAKLLPRDHRLQQILGSAPHHERIFAKFAADPLRYDGTIPEVDTLLDLARGNDHLVQWLAWASPAVAETLAGAVDPVRWDAFHLRAKILMATDSDVPVPESSRVSTYGAQVADVVRHRAYIRGQADNGKSAHEWAEYRPSANGPTFKDVVLGSRTALDRVVETVFAGAKFKHVTCGAPLFFGVAEPRRYPLATWISRRHRDDFDLLVVDECFPGDVQIATPGGAVPIRDIRVGDLVWSMDSAGRVVPRPVRRVIAVPNRQGLVRVQHEHGSVECTPGHKFILSDGSKVEADLLVPGTVGHAHHHESLRDVRPTVHMSCASPPGAEILFKGVCGHTACIDLGASEERDGGTVSDCDSDLRVVCIGRGTACHDAESLLLKIMQAERKLGGEFDAPCQRFGGGETARDARVSGLGLSAHECPEQRSECARENDGGAQGPRTDETWRERDADRGAADSPCRYGVSDGGGYPDREPILAFGTCGSGASDVEGGHRVRWCQPPHPQAEESRPDQDDHVGRLGLGRPSLLELPDHFGSAASAGGDSGCREIGIRSVTPIERPEVQVVFDLEVEDTHSYFANSILVSNCHEFSSEDSAQSHAKARLEAGRAFRLALTGSFVNGYADSAYNNMYSVSKAFRAEYGRDGRTRFVDRFGYWKQIVQEKDQKSGQIVEFGSQSDRVLRTARRSGMAPGVLPLFNLQWLLPHAATLQKTDLHLGLPDPEHRTDQVALSPEQDSNYRFLLACLLETIKETRFKEGLAGKLWGALAHLPSYLDLAACGPYEIRWPEHTPECGGEVIAAVPSLDPGQLLPKEEWMLRQVEAEIEAGRPVLVLAWHRVVLERLMSVLSNNGHVGALYLDAQQVATGKRQAWIDKHVIRQDCPVMVVNPVAIQTGLNNLVHFKTQLWMENPACNPHIFRQAQGRIDRVGQKVTPRFVFPLYAPSAQEQSHRLLLHKVGVALGVDGLDPEAALRAAGVDDEGFRGLSVGRALYRMLVGE